MDPNLSTRRIPSSLEDPQYASSPSTTTSREAAIAGSNTSRDWAKFLDFGRVEDGNLKIRILRFVGFVDI